MNVRLWIAGLNPFQTESGQLLKEIDLRAILDLESISSNIIVRFNALYAFIAHDKTLSTFSVLLDQRRKISFNDTIVSLESNSKHSLVLLSSGLMFKYDPVEDRATPVDFLRVENAEETPLKESITHLACGEYITVVCTSSKSVYNVPNRTATFPKHTRFRKLVAGFEHCLLLTANGDVYSWGGGLRGQLGNGEIVAAQDQPKLVEALAGVKIVDIAADGWHSAAVSSFGDLYTWGWNNQGQLGLQDEKHNGCVVSQPQLVIFPGDNEVTVHKVHCGIGHTVVEVTTMSETVRECRVVGWDFQKRFDYTRAVVPPTFHGFRSLEQPVEETDYSMDVGAAANLIYFLQRSRGEYKDKNQP